MIRLTRTARDRDRPRAWQAMFGGFRFVAAHPVARAMVVLGLVPPLLLIPSFSALMPVFAADVFAVEDDAAAADLQMKAAEEAAEGGLVAEVGAGAQPGERHGPEHGPGVEVLVAEPPGQLLRGAAFARSRRAVDGNDHG